MFTNIIDTKILNNSYSYMIWKWTKWDEESEIKNIAVKLYFLLRWFHHITKASSNYKTRKNNPASVGINKDSEGKNEVTDTKPQAGKIEFPAVMK